MNLEDNSYVMNKSYTSEVEHKSLAIDNVSHKTEGSAKFSMKREDYAEIFINGPMKGDTLVVIRV